MDGKETKNDFVFKTYLMLDLRHRGGDTHDTKQKQPTHTTNELRINEEKIIA